MDFERPSEIVRNLKEALARTCNNLTKTGRHFCFFLDGLDDYNGNTADIIGLVRRLRAVQHVKLCVSSRPWIKFNEAYDTMKLLMHGFNDRDINAYVDDVFRNSVNYLEVEDKETRGDYLKQDVVDAAHGVFLWVVHFRKACVKETALLDRNTDYASFQKSSNLISIRFLS